MHRPHQRQSRHPQRQHNHPHRPVNPSVCVQRPRLVWYEIYHSPTAAIAREKQLKGWTRAEKIALIEQTNPDWRDLSEDRGKPIAL
jgi:putative endonuclease